MHDLAERQQSKARLKRYLAWRMQMSLVSALLVGIAALAMAIAYQRLLAAKPSAVSVNSANSNVAAEFDGSIVIDPPLAMPDFSLRDQYQRTVNLSDLRGRFVLLTFGYTNCPDICPLTLGEFHSARQALGAASADVAFVFISVDGQRDSPDALRRYFELRGLEGIIGLSGAEDRVRALGKDYGLSFEMTEPDQYGGYLVDHTAGSFLLDRQQRWIRRYQFGLPPDRIIDDLKTLLAA